MEYLHAVDEAQRLGYLAGSRGDERRVYAFAAGIFRSVPPDVAAEARRAYYEGYREAKGLPALES